MVIIILMDDKDKGVKKVVIGMTGSIDSTIAAYLLNKQNYQCIGIGVSFISEDEKKVKPEDSIFGLCNNHNLEQTKLICQKLSMPFYAVNAKEMFKSEVIDYVISSRLQGRKFSYCIKCTQLLMGILLEKATLLGAEYVATGHYAKISYNRDREDYSLHASSDLEDDQSYLMSLLNAEHLKRLILPLGDMRKKEVVKISHILNYKFKDTRKKSFCFENDKMLIKAVEENSTEEFWKEGDILSLQNNDVLGEHKGLFKYKFGQNKFSSEDEGALKNYKVVDMNPDQAIIIVDKQKDNMVDYCQINNLLTINKIDSSRPFTAYAQWGIMRSKFLCTIYFKSFNHVLLIFAESHEGPIGRGTIISFYNKNTRNAQLVGSGECTESGLYTLIDRLEGQLDEDTLVEVDEDRKTRNIDEYKF